MDKRKKRWIWAGGAVIWPATIVLCYAAAPPHISGNAFDLAAMAVLMVLSSLCHFKVKGTTIVVLSGVSIAVFLIFGLFVELILLQLGTFAYMLSRRLGKEDWYRFPVNMTMFALVSVVSGVTFYLLGGKTGVLSGGGIPQLIPIFGYITMSYISNHLFLYFFYRLFIGAQRFIGKDAIWELVTTLLVAPVGVVLYLLYSQLGTTAICFIAVPLITLSVIFRLIKNSYDMNNLLQKTNEIGRQLTEKLEVNHIVKLFFERVAAMIEVDYALILIGEDGQDFRIVDRFVRESETLDRRTDGAGSAKWPGDLTGRIFRAGVRKEWWPSLHGLLPDYVESVLVVPTRRNTRVVGAVVIATKTRRAYGKEHLTILEILANFLMVAVGNAQDYERTKYESERDPLTNLYNYRYFMKLLTEMFEKSTGSPFTIIMIDLDHFKQINDRFGHENGNRVLTGVAARLVEIVGDKGTVARYGGEEFIVLLPDADGQAAYLLADTIRIRLSDEPFSLYELGDDERQRRRLVRVTASIGLATAPEQGEDPLSLIRNADRAMYAGAKRQGRNRVATYIQ